MFTHLLGGQLSYPPVSCTPAIPAEPLYNFSTAPDGGDPELIYNPHLYHDADTVTYPNQWEMKNGELYCKIPAGSGGAAALWSDFYISGRFNAFINVRILATSDTNIWYFTWYMFSTEDANDYFYWQWNSDRRDWRWVTVKNSSATFAAYVDSLAYERARGAKRTLVAPSESVAGLRGAYGSACSDTFSQYAGKLVTQHPFIMAFVVSSGGTSNPEAEVAITNINLCSGDATGCL
jgi:hypothetical protein